MENLRKIAAGGPQYATGQAVIEALANLPAWDGESLGSAQEVVDAFNHIVSAAEALALDGAGGSARGRLLKELAGLEPAWLEDLASVDWDPEEFSQAAVEATDFAARARAVLGTP